MIATFVRALACPRQSRMHAPARLIDTPPAQKKFFGRVKKTAAQLEREKNSHVGIFGVGGARKGDGGVSSAVKTLENQTKHLTNAEIEARAAAEASVMPDRGREADLAKPVKGCIGAAGTYWRTIVKRLDGVALLDDLDREALGIYCQMLARRDRLNRLCERLLADACKEDGGAMSTEATDKLDSLSAKLATLERNIMAYADKLGFTPQSRVRLAQKRAAAAAGDADADFFGD